MVMVRIVRSGFSDINVYIKISNAGLRLINGYLQSNSICQQGKNIVFRKLRSKVQCFMRPDFS